MTKNLKTILSVTKPVYYFVQNMKLYLNTIVYLVCRYLIRALTTSCIL
jgi:hypothetical protein